MSFNEEIKKWNDLFSEDKLSKKYVKKNQNFDQEFINNFYQDLRVSDDSIYGEYGIGYSKINSVIVKKIVDILTWEYTKTVTSFICSLGEWRYL